jgi:hypothetical protein
MDMTARQSRGGRQGGIGAPNDVRLTGLGSVRRDDRAVGQIGDHLSRHAQDVLADPMQRDPKKQRNK